MSEHEHEFSPSNICLTCGIARTEVQLMSLFTPVDLAKLAAKLSTCVDSDDCDTPGLEQLIEEKLICVLQDLAYSLSTLREIRRGTSPEEAISYDAAGVTLETFRREAPALLAELTLEVSKL